jgi:hypothetical protein
MSEKAFRDDVEKTILLYEDANGYAASRTRQMIAKHGEIKAISILMVSADLQQGFEVLRDSNQLDKTFESLVVKNHQLFEVEIVEAAKWRLEHPYDLFAR